MFRVDMLPAAHGDALWIEYGDPAAPHRMIVDGGPYYAYHQLFDRIVALPRNQREFELLVITHIDADHIEGCVRLLRDASALGCTFNRIWFNGHEQLNELPAVPGDLGALSGEYLSLVIRDYERDHQPVLNSGLHHKWVGVTNDALPCVLLPGNLTLTVLSPSVTQLHRLAAAWDRVLARLGIGQDQRSDAAFRLRLEADARLRPLTQDGDDGTLGGSDESSYATEPVKPERLALGSDATVPNGSSIALLAEHPDGVALLAGDAHAQMLTESIDLLRDERKVARLPVDFFKLPHHGSAGNVSPALLQSLSVGEYLVSTNGAMFGHPADACIEALLDFHDPDRGPAQLRFNYRSPRTLSWLNADAPQACENPRFLGRAEPGEIWPRPA